MAQQTLRGRETIAAANQAWMSAIQSGDAAGLAALYAEDGQLLAPGGACLQGKPAIQAYWQSRLDASVRQADLEVLDLEVYSDLDQENNGDLDQENNGDLDRESNGDLDREDDGDLDQEDDGDLALERTLYTMRDENGRVVDTGQYVLLWARVDGHWELHRDILNSSLTSSAS